jgi:hypothetical protein
LNVKENNLENIIIMVYFVSIHDKTRRALRHHNYMNAFCTLLSIAEGARRIVLSIALLVRCALFKSVDCTRPQQVVFKSSSREEREFNELASFL